MPDIVYSFKGKKKRERAQIISELFGDFKKITYLCASIKRKGIIMDTLDKDFWQKRDAAMKRFMAAKERKKARVAEITQSLREDFKEQMGTYPKYVNVW